MRIKTIILTALVLLFVCPAGASAEEVPDRKEVLEVMKRVNGYFMEKYNDPTAPSYMKRIWPSNIWTRTVYYEGLMALYGIHPREEYYDYAYNWAEFHKWGMYRGTATRHADNQACGQIYIDLYKMEPTPDKLRKIRASIDAMVNSPQIDDWWWVDALQMAMPTFARLGEVYNDSRYFEKMYEMYAYTKNHHGGNGLYNSKDGLWWRDSAFVPPYKEPNGKNCYWSRGNGWVYAALLRVMECIPEDEPHRKEYLDDFLAMSKAIKSCQREDGFWNVSLHDPGNYGGKETSGTALFVYGMAWGINQGILDRTEYLPVVLRAWNAMVKDSVHENGYLGWVQGTGKEPKDGQPLTYDKVPDFEDYGVGCFLLGASEVYKLR